MRGTAVRRIKHCKRLTLTKNLFQTFWNVPMNGIRCEEIPVQRIFVFDISFLFIININNVVKIYMGTERCSCRFIIHLCLLIRNCSRTIKSLALGRCGNNLKDVSLETILRKTSMSNFCKIALGWILNSTSNDKFALDRVMACCRQETSCYRANIGSSFMRSIPIFTMQ